MAFALAWLISIVVAFVMNAVSKFKFYKNVADNSYILDIKNFYAFLNSKDYSDIPLSSYKKKLTTLNLDSASIFLPVFINIIVEMLKAVDYNRYCHCLMDYLNVMKVVIPMSESEEKDYLKNPSGLSAWVLFSKNQDMRDREEFEREIAELAELYKEKSTKKESVRIIIGERKTTAKTQEVSTNDGLNNDVKKYTYPNPFNNRRMF